MINPPPPIRSPIIDANGMVTDVWQAFFNTFYSAVNPIPVGVLWPFGGNNPPTGWLVCNGGAVARGKYPNLYSVIGTVFGAGDGVTTFNLPDLSGKFIRGSMGAIGETGGASEITIAEVNLPPLDLTVSDPGHTHTFTGEPHSHEITDPGHTHTFTGEPHSHEILAGVGTGGLTPGGIDAPVSTEDSTADGNIGTSGTDIAINDATADGTNAGATTGITVALEGGGDPISILPEYLSLAYIIKY